MKILKNKVLLLFVVVFFNSVSVYSQTWTLIAKKPGGESYYMKNVFHENNIYNKKIWVKHNAPKLTTYMKDGKSVVFLNAHEIKLYEFSCSGRQLMLYEVIVYNSKGVMVNHFKEEEYERSWSDAVPDSMGEMLLDKACLLF